MEAAHHTDQALISLSATKNEATRGRLPCLLLHTLELRALENISYHVAEQLPFCLGAPSLHVRVTTPALFVMVYSFSVVGAVAVTENSAAAPDAALTQALLPAFAIGIVGSASFNDFAVTVA